MVARRIYPLLALVAAASMGTADVPPVEHPAPVSRIEQLLSDWQKLARRSRSLAVEFTVRERDAIRQTTKEFTGTLKVLKKPGDPLQGYYEVRPKGKPSEARFWLTGEQLFMWFRSNGKKLLVLTVKQEDTFDFLVNHLHPCILCLDKRRSEQKYRLRLTKQDKWYTYLEVTNREGKVTPFEGGWLAVENHPSANIPPDMPRQLVDLQPGALRTIDIVRWRLDDVKAVRDEDFKAPSGPDWKVVKWLFEEEK